MQAATSTGALPRIIEQAGLERKYEEFQRQRGELGKVPGIAQSAFGTNVPYGFKDFQPQGAAPQASTLERIMGNLPGLIQGGKDIFGMLPKSGVPKNYGDIFGNPGGRGSNIFNQGFTKLGVRG